MQPLARRPAFDYPDPFSLRSPDADRGHAVPSQGSNLLTADPASSQGSYSLTIAPDAFSGFVLARDRRVSRRYQREGCVAPIVDLTLSTVIDDGGPRRGGPVRR